MVSDDDRAPVIVSRLRRSEIAGRRPLMVTGRQWRGLGGVGRDGGLELVEKTGDGAGLTLALFKARNCRLRRAEEIGHAALRPT